MSRDEWITDFAARLGLSPPTAEEIDDLLDLAATAAHSSHRTAAPLACWLAGASGRPPAELKQLAEGVTRPG
ncbi:MAG TPA: DUF6457 domain-containing protein [Solirubrobacterales bacterium]|nr:DUF6457 domain-containing protein [Solirubrobacterales bacterium]